MRRSAQTAPSRYTPFRTMARAGARSRGWGRGSGLHLNASRAPVVAVSRVGSKACCACRRVARRLVDPPDQERRSVRDNGATGQQRLGSNARLHRNSGRLLSAHGSGDLLRCLHTRHGFKSSNRRAELGVIQGYASVGATQKSLSAIDRLAFPTRAPSLFPYPAWAGRVDLQRAPKHQSLQ